MRPSARRGGVRRVEPQRLRLSRRMGAPRPRVGGAPADDEQVGAQPGGTGLTFEFDAEPFEFSPGLARVLLRIMRKAADRDGIDLNDMDRPRPLTSRPS